MKMPALLAAAALAAGPAIAQPVSQPPRYTGDLAGFSGDPAALPRAISAIEAADGRVMEIRYDGRAAPGYDVVVVRGGRLQFVRVAEPYVGLTAIVGSSRPAWMLGWRGRREVKAVRRARVGLASAVRDAEADANHAPAVAAGIAASASNPASDVKAYNVLVETRSGPRRIAIDAATGDPIANPGVLRRWP